MKMQLLQQLVTGVVFFVLSFEHFEPSLTIFFSHLHLVTNIQNQNVKTEKMCYKISFVFKNTYAKINAGYCGDHVGPTTTRQISCFVVTFRFCWSIQKVSFYSY